MHQTGYQRVTRNGCTSARALFATPDASQAGPSHVCYVRDTEPARSARAHIAACGYWGGPSPGMFPTNVATDAQSLA